MIRTSVILIKTITLTVKIQINTHKRNKHYLTMITRRELILETFLITWKICNSIFHWQDNNKGHLYELVDPNIQILTVWSVKRHTGYSNAHNPKDVFQLIFIDKKSSRILPGSP